MENVGYLTENTLWAKIVEYYVGNIEKNYEKIINNYDNKRKLQKRSR